jgi:hypothetical protein
LLNTLDHGVRRSILGFCSSTCLSCAHASSNSFFCFYKVPSLSLSLSLWLLSHLIRVHALFMLFLSLCLHLCLYARGYDEREMRTHDVAARVIRTIREPEHRSAGDGVQRSVAQLRKVNPLSSLSLSLSQKI